MDKLEYYGNLVDDIKLIKKYTAKKDKLFFRLDLTYLGILIVYLIAYLGLFMAGIKMPIPALYINYLIIYRNIFFIYRLSKKNRADDARRLINNLISKIFKERNQDNNYSEMLDIEDFENSVIVSDTNKEKEYDENGKIISNIEEFINYIYFIDKEDRINALKEIRKVIKIDGEDEEIQKSLELLTSVELPENIPVKQTLKLKKNN